MVDGLPVTFFGGTALCRTHCRGIRLSEDIDLLVEDHRDAAARLPALIAPVLRKEFPSLHISDGTERESVCTQHLDAGRGVVLRMQSVQWRQEWRALPVRRTGIHLGYPDLPEQVHLDVPTPSAFVALKLLAWGDRHAPRDLFDLHALARRGFVDASAVHLFRITSGVSPLAVVGRDSLPEGVVKAWKTELGNQLRSLPSPRDCLSVLRSTLERPM